MSTAVFKACPKGNLEIIAGGRGLIHDDFGLMSNEVGITEV